MYGAANMIAAHVHVQSFLITYANICLRSTSVNRWESENDSKYFKMTHLFPENYSELFKYKHCQFFLLKS